MYLYVAVVKKRLSKRFWRGPFVITEKISPVNYKLRWLSSNRPLRLISRHEFPSDGYIPIGGEMFPPLEVTEDELNDNQYGPLNTSDKPNHESQSGGG